MEHLIIDTIIEKVDLSENRLDNHEKEIAEIRNKFSEVTDQSQVIEQLSDLIKELQGNMKTLHWPAKAIVELSDRLARHNELSASPQKTKQVVIHTAGKLIWVIIFLIFSSIGLAIGWIHTNSKLEQFLSSSIMWRYIKITNRSQNLDYLHAVEKLYLSDPEKMQSFVEAEDLRERQIKEASEKVYEDSTELGKLKMNAKVGLIDTLRESLHSNHPKYKIKK